MPSVQDMKKASAVIVFTGDNLNGFAAQNSDQEALLAPLSAADLSVLHSYVAGGGKLFVSGKGAALAVTEAGKKGAVKIVAMDRNPDMLPYIEDGTIYGSVAQKSYVESFLGVHLLHWLNTNGMKIVPDAAKAGINPLPEKIVTGVMSVTKENVAEFKAA